jgi:hypothetical protein
MPARCSHSEWCPASVIGVQQPPVLLHQALHLLQVVVVGRVGDGLHVLLIRSGRVHEDLPVCEEGGCINSALRMREP